MSRAYKQRLKAIRDEKRRLGLKKIPTFQFGALQGKWRDAIDGPPICTLEDLLALGSR